MICRLRIISLSALGLGFTRGKTAEDPRAFILHASVLDTSGIEPDTSRMLSERDKPTTPCAHGRLPLPFGLDQHNPSFFPNATLTFDEHR